jgi:hypothetical protein
MENEIDVSKPNGKTFRYNELPKGVQQKLLTLQNGTGDYYKLTSGFTTHFLRIVSVGICFVLLGFFGLLYIIFAGAGLRAVWFSIMFVVLIWVVYSGWRLAKSLLSPIKDATYVTPTQSISVLASVGSGLITYSDLKDFTTNIEFETKKIKHRSGKRRWTETRHYMKIAATNGTTHTINFKSIAEAQMWREKFVQWINYAHTAAKQNSFAYFDSWNIFRGATPISSENKPGNLGFYALISLAIITFALPLAVFLASSYLVENTTDTASWENAKAKNTVTEYMLYQKNGGKNQQHFDEAKQKSVAFYDEAISTVKLNQASSKDKSGSETFLKMLENAKSSFEINTYPNEADNRIYLGIDLFSVKNSGQKNKEEYANKLDDKLKTSFPSEVLKVYQTTDFGFKETKSVLKIRIEDAKNAKDTSKFDVTCEAKTANKAAYNFEMKSATFDEFLSEFGKRFGLDK